MPLVLSLVTISSMAALDGAHIRILSTPEQISIEIIPEIVCVFPVPGYINELVMKYYWTLNKLDAAL
jgi:hypothetical protein